MRGCEVFDKGVAPVMFKVYAVHCLYVRMPMILPQKCRPGDGAGERTEGVTCDKHSVRPERLVRSCHGGLVALGFAAGFASEPILVAIRALVEKLLPARPAPTEK